MNEIKPQFKRFEMHGNLPAVLQHGIVVSASINNLEEVDKESINKIGKNSAGRGRMTSNTRNYEQRIYLQKEITI